MSTAVVATQTTGRSGFDYDRVVKSITDVVDRQKGRVVMSMVATRQTERLLAYGAVRLDDRVMRHIASKGLREVGGKLVFVGLRVGFKAVPIIGWASLAYDLYQLGTVLEQEFEISEKVRA
jgi:hypothetical protein